MRKRIPHMSLEGVEHKYCKPCDNWYPLTEFNKKQASYDGLETKCKKCAQNKSASFREHNPDFDRDYQAKNSDRLKVYKREYYLKKKLERLN